MSSTVQELRRQLAETQGINARQQILRRIWQEEHEAADDSERQPAEQECVLS